VLKNSSGEFSAVLQGFTLSEALTSLSAFVYSAGDLEGAR